MLWDCNIYNEINYTILGKYKLIIVPCTFYKSIFTSLFSFKKINLQGSIEDPVTKREWKSSKNMTSEELGIIAATAKKVNKNHKNKYVTTYLMENIF